MSRARAHEILTLWREGAQEFTHAVISMALFITGDLDASSLPEFA